MTNQCAVFSQIITLLLDVSKLVCHIQGSRSQYLAKLHKNPTRCDSMQISVVSVVTRIPPQPSHTETPTHIETRTHDQCGDTIEKSQAPDDGCINVRNMLSIEEVK